MTDKQMAMDVVGKLPEEVSLKQIREELDIVLGIQRGLVASASGEVKSHEEVKAMVSAWTAK